MTRNVSRPSGWNPNGTRSRARKLRRTSPLPTSTTTPSAVSATISKWRTLRPEPAGDSRAPSFNESRKLLRVAARAGAIPKSKAAKSEIARVNASTVPLTPISPKSGRSCGLIACSAFMPQSARSRPEPPPRNARSMFSVSSWRRMRIRWAPSATRTAISRLRAEARAINRFATLAQTMRRTKPTAPRRTKRAVRTFPTI